jgi:hypothetical protein
MQTQKMTLENIQGKLTRTEMKNIQGGKTQTFCGGCSNMNGTLFQQSNVVCVSLPADAICQDLDGQYGLALFCGTTNGDQWEFSC